MQKKLYAFVGPKGGINRLFETEQADVPDFATQILLTDEQFEQVKALRKDGKRAGWKNNSVVEWSEPAPE